MEVRLKKKKNLFFLSATYESVRERKRVRGHTFHLFLQVISTLRRR